MKLNDKQAQMLFMLAKDALTMDKQFSFEKTEILKLINSILNQQSEEIVDLEQVDGKEKDKKTT
tara:strand:- start:533 stop:724 length:192 start_codon:yes stop_codon:yes gene_type:complete